MRKIYTIGALVLISAAAIAQSQRLVLLEEFTQASCGPCAAANPAFNALLDNNEGKAISIKYQVSWPGTDPMNAQYPVAVASRVNYYSVGSVPYAIMDGVAVTGASYTGYPGNCTQAKIDNEYAVSSPFSINVSHTLNAAQDSIFITAAITATQAFTGVSFLRAHIVLIEKHIHFTSPPGSNGETDFYNVCRKMFPSQSGTGLPLTWSPGDDSIITVKAAIPSYIYDIDELAVVCFVQDNGNKQVMQAGYSISPVGIHNYVDAPAFINLFPNPASDRVNISFSLPQSSELTINIYNEVGVLVRSEKRGLVNAGKQEMELNIEMLASGMYMVELVAGDAKSTSRLNVVH